MYSLLQVERYSCQFNNNTIQSHFKHNPESNIVPTAGFLVHFCQVWKGIWDFNSISEENAKNIHNCSVADKLSLYKSSNKKLPACWYK
jgi:hypothetical protein